MMAWSLKGYAIAAIAAWSAVAGMAVAGDDNAERISARGEGELGLNVFGLSFHADRDARHNEVNPGLGLRYPLDNPAPRWHLFGEASFYYDSSREWAKYAALGTAYRFAESWTVGAAIAYAQSRSYNKAQPFFAVIPALSYGYGRVVFNVVLLPSESADSKIAGLALYVTLPLRHLVSPATGGDR